MRLNIINRKFEVNIIGHVRSGCGSYNIYGYSWKAHSIDDSRTGIDICFSYGTYVSCKSSAIRSWKNFAKLNNILNYEIIK